MLFVAIALAGTVSVSAFDLARWIEVDGGAWHPTPAQLSELDIALKPAVVVASKNRGRIPKWAEYTSTLF